MSFRWGTHYFNTLDQLRKWVEENVKGKKLKVEDHDNLMRSISDQDGKLIDVQKLHPVVQANGRVWYSSWYKPEYPYKRKSKSLKQRLAEVKKLEPAE